MVMIKAENLTKIYKKQIKQFWLKALIRPKWEEFKAVDSISFEIEKGETFGLLGPNGAGKTTTIQMLSGIEHPTMGKVYIDGLELEANYREISDRFNILFSDKLLYNRLTAYDNLVFYANLYSIEYPEEKAENLLELLDLVPWRDQYVEHFSLGMRMKLAFARSLVNDPEILYLDEPTLGLDIKNAEMARKFLKNLDCTILLTTHYLNEAIIMCDRIGILQKGKIMHIGTPEDLKKMNSNQRVITVSTNDNQKVKKILSKNPFVDEIKEKNTRLELTVRNCDNYFVILNDIKEFKLYEFQELKTGLEGLFFDVEDEPEKNDQPEIQVEQPGAP